MSPDPTPFLGLPSPGIDLADALILPLPLEQTVTYGKGTGQGPQAILDASRQIELFEEETLLDFTERPKVHTLPPLTPDASLTPEGLPEYLGEVRRFVERLGLRGPDGLGIGPKCLSQNPGGRTSEPRASDNSGIGSKFLVSLGGEHTVTYGVATGLVDDPAELTIIHIDAHADLIDQLGGRRWSHGTVMRRLWELGCRLIQIGIRSLSRSEYELIRTGDRVVTYFAHTLAERWEEMLGRLGGLDGKVYVSIDVDGLDPGVIPSTGTPQPGGLTWRETMQILRAIAAAPGCRWIGADVVEFVPSPHPPGCDLTAARLVMKVLAWWAASRKAC